MRHSALILSTLVGLLSTSFGPDIARAHEETIFLRPRTLRDFAHSYTVRDEPRSQYLERLFALNDRIRLLDVRIAMLRERLADYRRFPRSPFMITVQNAEFQLIEAQQVARRLRRDRALLSASR